MSCFEAAQTLIYNRERDYALASYDGEGAVEASIAETAKRPNGVSASPGNPPSMEIVTPWTEGASRLLGCKRDLQMSASRRLQPAGERKYLSFLGGQHAESDRPRATLEPLAWRFLIAELAIGSGSVCAIVYAAISSISISAHSALSSGLSEPWVTTPIPKSPEGTPQRHRDASVKPFRTGACPHDRKSSRSRYANLRRDGRQFLGRAEHREPRRPALIASAIRPGAPCGLRQNCRVDKPPRPRARR
jgi:hypothetical protein